MIILILTMLLGIVFAIFATQNTTPVPINIADITYSFPLYLVLAAGLIFGLLIGTFYNLFEKISSYTSIRSKDADIRKLSNRNKELRHKIELMESRNNELKDNLGEKKSEIREQKIENVKDDTKDFFGRIKRSLSF